MAEFDIGNILDKLVRDEQGSFTKDVSEKLFERLTTLASSGPGASAYSKNAGMFNEAIRMMSEGLIMSSNELNKAIDEYSKTTGIFGLISDNIGQFQDVIANIVDNLGFQGEQAEEIKQSFNKVGESASELASTLERVNAMATETVNDMFQPLEGMLSKIPIIGKLSDKLLEPIKGKFTDTFREKIFSPLESQAGAVGQKAAMLLTNPWVLAAAALVAATIGAFIFIGLKFTKTAAEISKELGITFSHAGEISERIVATSFSTQRFGIELEEIQQTAIGLIDELNQMDIPADTLRNIVMMGRALGLSAEENVALQSTLTNALGIQFDDLQGQRDIYNAIVMESGKLNMSTADIAKGIAASKKGASILLSVTREQRQEFVHQVAAAEKLGKSFDEMIDTFAIFEDPIEAFSKLTQLAQVSGINIDVARQAHLRWAGDFATANEEVISALASELNMIDDQVQRTLVLKAASEALGVSREEIVNLIERQAKADIQASQRAAGILSFQEQINSALSETMGLEDRRGPFAQMWSDIKESLMPAIKELQPMTIKFIEMFGRSWKLVLPVFRLIGTILSWIAKIINFILTPIVFMIDKVQNAAGFIQKILGISPSMESNIKKGINPLVETDYASGNTESSKITENTVGRSKAERQYLVDDLGEAIKNVEKERKGSTTTVNENIQVDFILDGKKMDRQQIKRIKNY